MRLFYYEMQILSEQLYLGKLFSGITVHRITPHINIPKALCKIRSIKFVEEFFREEIA